MSKFATSNPKHRAALASTARGASRSALRTTVALGGVAAVAAVTVAAGAAPQAAVTAESAPPAARLSAALGAVDPPPPATENFVTAENRDAAGGPDADDRRAMRVAERAPELSRSAQRGGDDQGRGDADDGAATAGPTGAPRDIARALLPSYGFGADQFGCLDSLWMKESGWDVHADNPTSSAYGIPQALPGSKMASAGADWSDNPATQIRWGLGYIRDTYGSPCSAWSHSQSMNWY